MKDKLKIANSQFKICRHKVKFTGIENSLASFANLLLFNQQSETSDEQPYGRSQQQFTSTRLL
jgi:hypothetical protein